MSKFHFGLCAAANESWGIIWPWSGQLEGVAKHLEAESGRDVCRGGGTAGGEEGGGEPAAAAEARHRLSDKQTRSGSRRVVIPPKVTQKWQRPALSLAQLSLLSYNLSASFFLALLVIPHAAAPPWNPLRQQEGKKGRSVSPPSDVTFLQPT